jgi:hypothetical protein
VFHEPAEVEMPHSTHTARVIGPITFVAPNGRTHTIPVGPCLVEELNDNRVDLVWGTAGEKSAELPVTEAERAAREGRLVLLD